jgi:hypothetical protein
MVDEVWYLGAVDEKVLSNGRAAADGARSSSIPTATGVKTAGPGKTAANPTAGLHEYKDTYKIQQPYDLKVSDRFLEANGEYICWVNKTDKPLRQGSGTGARTEMRWNKDWTKTEHMWEGDVMFEPGTERTCIMQIKSNTGGEPIYLQVQNNNVYNDNNLKTVLLADAAGKWFHVVAAYNPTAGVGRVWINGELKITREYKKPLDTEWYFKNGVYNTSKFSKAHFKNIRFWSE